MLSNSKSPARSRKAKKSLTASLRPHPDFPLSAHPSGSWQKKVRGKVHYFGPWGRVKDGKLERLPDDGAQAALEKWLEQKDDLLAGRVPRAKQPAALTVRDLCNRFLTAKKILLDAGDLVPRSFGEYLKTTERMVNVFGGERLVSDLRPEDFERLRAALGKTYGPIRIGNEIQRTRSVFLYAFESELIERPVRFGPLFKRPAKHVFRKARAANGEKMFEAAELRQLIEAAPVALKAMILLGVNAGMGNTDCGSLREKHLKHGWYDCPRSKTGIERRAWLWPETQQAIKAAIAARPAPRDEADSDLVFLTSAGTPWTIEAGLREVTRTDGKVDYSVGPRVDEVTREFRHLMEAQKLKRPGRGFYSLRHTTETIGSDAKDQVALNLVMGHADHSMSDHYRERIDDSRLKAIADHMRGWLFAAKEGGAR
jgi:integrase